MKKFVVSSLICSSLITVLSPFSIVYGEESVIPSEQISSYSDEELLKMIAELEVQELEASGYEDFQTLPEVSEEQNGIILTDPKAPKPEEGYQGAIPIESGGTSWSLIATGSRVISKTDFYASGTMMAILTTFLGWGSASRTVLAALLGVSLASVPSALPGETLRFKKEFKWVDKPKFIYDVKTTEYIYRNGKTAIVGQRVVRENGWGND